MLTPPNPPKKEGPFLPGLKARGTLGRFGEQQPQKEYGSEGDDFDQTTEQMSRIVIASPVRLAPVPGDLILPRPEREVPQAPLPIAPVRARRSPIPIIVGTFLLVLQMLLLARFVLKTLNVPADSLLVQGIYTLSGVFAQPFYALGRLIPLSFPQETYTLLALLVYGLIARILMRFLKALLNTN